MPVTDLIKVQMGQEGTWGTCVAATAKLMGVTEATLEIVDEVHQTEKSGFYYPSDLVAEVSFMGEGSITMDLTYEDILYPLENFFDAIETHTATATGPWTWSYDAPTTTTVTPQHLTIEFGAPDAEYEACGVLFTELNISGEAGGVWVGEFPFLCADIDDAAMATGTAVADRAVELIRMADTELYMDTWTHTGARTKIDDTLVSFELHVENGRHAKVFAGSVQPDDWGDTQWTGTLTTVLEFNASGKAIVDALLAPALVQRMLRIVGTSGAKSVTLDFDGTLVNGAELFSDRDGNVTVELEWQGTYNDTNTNWLGVDVVNSVQTLQ